MEREGAVSGHVNQATTSDQLAVPSIPLRLSYF